MALEALAALGLASSIVQFVDFGSKLFSKSRELYQNSARGTSEDRQLEFIARFVQRLSDNLDATIVDTARPSPAESDLKSLTKECKMIADDLLAALEKLKTKDPRRKWDCLRVSLKRIWKSEKIDDLARRLDSCSGQITVCLVQLLNDKQSKVLSSLQFLTEANQQSQSKVDAELENMRLASLDILRKLESIHGEHTSKVEREANRDQVKAAQLTALSFKLESMVKTGGRLATEYRILESLWYKRMEMREAKIADAHRSTFEWIFGQSNYDASSTPSSELEFFDWLTGGSGIFWITGKAGSGKSTLMKFISRYSATREALRLWAADKKLIIASFFFWYAGTELQNSQEGLLQSLLHKILTECPELIPVVLPSRWKECSCTHASSSHWTRTELMDAFAELAKQTMLSTKFCFFVDGLDEYCGDHQEITNLLQAFTHSDHIKICVSSRPWNVFVLAFERASYPKLRLEDLTRDDIQLYVRDMLEENELFQERRLREPHRCDDLVDEVVQKASGVFLWVFLVVRSLLQGLTNADRIVDLQSRLRRFPSDLEEYFKHILESIDDTYREQTGRMFLTALHAPESLTLMTYVMMDEIEENPKFALDLNIRPMDLAQIDSNYADMKLRINARCKDLLEFTKVKRDTELCTSKPGAVNFSTPFQKESQLLHQDTDNQLDMEYDKKVFFRGNLRSNPFFEYEVDFLHRTVRDFLQIKEMHGILVKSVPEGFDPNAALCHAFLAQIKTVPLRADQLLRAGPLSDLVDDMMYYAHELENQTGVACAPLLDELSHVYKSRLKALQKSISFSTTTSIDPSLSEMRRSFLGFAAQRGLQLYVMEKLDEQHDDSIISQSLEDLILCSIEPSIASKYRVEANLELASLILRKGCRNKREIQSIWNLLINNLVNKISLKWVGESATAKKRQALLESIIILLDLGADPTEDYKWIEFIFMPEKNWRGYEIAPLLTQTIKKLLENGAKPNLTYKTRTVWCHFLNGICESHSRRTSLDKPPGWQKYALSAVQAFLDHGADRECELSNLSEKCSTFEGQKVMKLLSFVFTAGQMSTLGFDQEKPTTASSTPAIAPAQPKPKYGFFSTRRWF